LRILRSIGKDLNLRRISVTRNKYGDSTNTYVTSLIRCEVQIMTGEEAIVRAGVLKTGDAIGFFKPADDVKLHDEIEYMGKVWEIYDLFPETINGQVVFVEGHCKKKIE
jgi:hypothetical protein